MFPNAPKDVTSSDGPFGIAAGYGPDGLGSIPGNKKGSRYIPVTGHGGP
jgi:hypothetical protein